MINENMKKVLVALRSGEYPQSSETLQSDLGYCCLGVMCEVYEKETGDKLTRHKNSYLAGTDLEGHVFSKVQNWVGLRSFSGKFIGEAGGVNNSLIDMNDTLNKSFLEIADFIETNPAGLLV
jgi:hypothetical protein